MSTLLEATATENQALTPVHFQAWAPHPAAAPVTERDGDRLTIAANGTRTCTGGWQLHYSGVTPGRRCVVVVEVAHAGIAQPRDVLECIAIWGDPAADEARPGAFWEYLLPEGTWESPIRFHPGPVGLEPAGGPPWARTRGAASLLREGVRRHRRRAQPPPVDPRHPGEHRFLQRPL